MSAGAWIEAGYNARIDGRPRPPIALTPAAYWQAIGYDLAGELAEAQITETGTLDAMPTPDWPALVERVIGENRDMIEERRLSEEIADAVGKMEKELDDAGSIIEALRDSQNDAGREIARLRKALDDAQERAEGDAEEMDDLKGELEIAKQHIAALKSQIEQSRKTSALTRIDARHLADLADRPGSPRIVFSAAPSGGYTCQIVSLTGYEYAAANGLTPPAALEEARQRYERTLRGDNGRPVSEADRKQRRGERIEPIDYFTGPYGERADAGQEHEEGADAGQEHEEGADDHRFEAWREQQHGRR